MLTFQPRFSKKVDIIACTVVFPAQGPLEIEPAPYFTYSQDQNARVSLTISAEGK